MDMEKGFGIPPQTISRIQMTYTQRHNIELVPGRALRDDGTWSYAIASQGTGLKGPANWMPRIPYLSRISITWIQDEAYVEGPECVAYPLILRQIT
jgi:hypothetical protein